MTPRREAAVPPGLPGLTADYDSDPGRFLAAARLPQEDVHPHVAARLAAAGARIVIDACGGNGRLARLLPALGIRCVLVDLSPAMLALAPRPALRADSGRLPFAGGCADAVAALYALYHFDDPRLPIAEARRVLRPGGLFVTCAPNRDSDPELAGVVPGWGSRSTFDGEDAAGIVGSVFSQAGDEVEVHRWDGPLLTLDTADHAAAFLRVHGMGEQEARLAADRLDLPLPLTMRGCLVYSTKAR